MSVILDQFIHTLVESGLMSAEEIRAFLDGLPEEQRPADGEQLAKLLFRRKKLTKFQAQAVYQGKIKGLLVGNYLVLDKIGQGGMGHVYRAQHRRMKREVALKVLPSAMTKTPEAVQRFQREVEAVARLEHANIVTAHDADEADGVHFLVMQYVKGSDLAELVREKGPLSVAKGLDYIIQAGRGLEYAHAKGVIHRDIKPSNLLLDRSGTVKILDMGLARLEQEVGPDDSTAGASLTQSGQVMGTIDYMPPEQSMDSRKADQRADIYSLGCTLFYLLTGRPVYQGDTLAKKVLAHREDPIPSLRTLRPDAPDALDRVFQKMLAKRPDERHGTMSAVLTDLEACRAAVEDGGDETIVLSSEASEIDTSNTRHEATLQESGDEDPALENWLNQELPSGPTRFVANPTRRRQLTKQQTALATVAASVGFLLVFAIGLGFALRSSDKDGDAVATRAAEPPAASVEDPKVEETSVVPRADVSDHGGGKVAVNEAKDDAAVVTKAGPKWVSGDKVLPGVLSNPKRLAGMGPWNVVTRTPVNQSDRNCSLCWHPDGLQIAFADRDGGWIRICNSDDLGLARMLDSHTPLVVAADRQGNWLAAGEEGGAVRLWKWDGTPGPIDRWHKTPVGCVGWSPNGKTLASGTRDTIRLWSPHGDDPLALPHPGWARFLAWNADGTCLASGGSDGCIRIWNPENSAKIAEYDKVQGQVNGLAWSPDGKRLATSHDDQKHLDPKNIDLWIWDVASRKPIVSGDISGAWINGLDWHPQSGLAASHQDGFVSLVDPSDAKGIALSLQTRPVDEAHWSPDGTRIADSRGRLFRVEDKKLIELQPAWPEINVEPIEEGGTSGTRVTWKDGRSATVWADGRIEGEEELVERELSCVIEGADGRLELMKPSEFRERVDHRNVTQSQVPPTTPSGMSPPNTDSTTLPNGWIFSKPVNLGPAVNSSEIDDGPTLSGDGLTLYFSSNRPREGDPSGLWTCTRPSLNDPFATPTRLDLSANDGDSLRSPAISRDGLTLFFEAGRLGDQAVSDLWMCTRKSTDEPFGEPTSLGPAVNSEYADKHPAISADGLTLLFCSGRPYRSEDIVNRDIWMCRRESTSDSFGKAVNLGSTVNSRYNDEHPAISPDGLTLLFSSQRRAGWGKCDLWMSTRKSLNDPFGEPVNLGPDVNSTNDEGNPEFSRDGNTLLFRSDRPGGQGKTDLWTVQIERPATPPRLSSQPPAESTKAEPTATSPANTEEPEPDKKPKISWKLRHTLEGHTKTVSSVLYCPSKSMVVSGDTGGTLRFWKLGPNVSFTTADAGGHIYAMAVSPRQPLIAVCGSLGPPSLWNCVTGRAVGSLPRKTALSQCPSFSPNGTVLAWGEENVIRLCHIQTTQLREWHTNDNVTVTALCFSPNKPLLASGTHPGFLQFWNTNDGRVQSNLQIGKQRITDIAFSPDGSLLAAAGYDRTVSIVDVQSGDVTQQIKHRAPVIAVAFHPSGKVLAVCGHSPFDILLRDVATGEVLTNLVGHEDQMGCLAFSPDGKLLVSGGKDKTVRVWEITVEN